MADLEILDRAFSNTGESLHHMFAYVGTIDVLTIKPTDVLTTASFDPPDPRKKLYTEFFPKVCELRTDMDVSKLMAVSSDINKVC